MEKIRKYRILSFISGTTWIKFDDLKRDGGFHFGYFKGGQFKEHLKVNERGSIEKERYAGNIERYLNESAIANGFGDHYKYKPWLGYVLFGRVERKNDSTLIFHDAYFGTLEINWSVVKDGDWVLKKIPDDVIDDLIRFKDRAGFKYVDATRCESHE